MTKRVIARMSVDAIQNATRCRCIPDVASAAVWNGGMEPGPAAMSLPVTAQLVASVHSLRAQALLPLFSIKDRLIQ